MTFQHIAVIGPGLLGGSILLALKRHTEVTTSLWARREIAVLEARQREVADLCTHSLEEAVSNADLVILATPIGVMGELAEKMLPFLKPDAIVTDVGSVKGDLVSRLEPIFNDGPAFVGSHPMAGSEKLGVEQARADLFNGAACFITPIESSKPAAVKRVGEFWESFGMRIYELTPADHDAAVAAISHLPHAIAAILVDSALSDDPSRGDYIANGFRDTTRIASGSPEMWTGIMLENRVALREALLRFQSKLGDLLAFLDEVDEKNTQQFLASAKQLRDAAVD